MSIELVAAEDIKSGRGSGKKGTGEKYAKYRSAIAPHVSFLQEGVANSKDGSIRVRVTDLAKSMGMAGKHETSIYWGLKYVLFGDGLIVTTGQTKDNEPVLVIRGKKDGDILPPSLTKHVGSAVEVPDNPEETPEELSGEPPEEDED